MWIDNKARYREAGYAADYDKERFGGDFGAALAAKEVSELIDLIGDCRDRILDLGAGTGKLSLPLLRASRRVISVDSSLAMLRVASGKAGTQSLQLDGAACDAQRLCFTDRAFGCVVCSRVLMHVPEWKVALTEMCRVSNNAVVLDVPSRYSVASLDAGLKRLFRLVGINAYSYRTFSVRDVINELRSNGFRVVYVRKQFFLPFIIHRLIDRPNLSRRLEQGFKKLGLVRLLGGPVTVKAVREERQELG